MRYPAGHGEQTRQRILAEAGRAFRENGPAGVSISDIMGRLGITHGGFYAHFKSKEALLAAACTQALGETQARLVAAADRGGLEQVVAAYLSAEHRDHPSAGCLLPALAGEVAREGMAVRYAFTRALEGLVDALLPFAPPGHEEARRDRVLQTIASMAGSVLLARAVCDPLMSERILEGSRRVCLRLLSD